MKDVLILTLLAVTVGSASAELPLPKRNLIPSCGDMCLVYGLGTDAAMDTAEAMENMVRHWKGHGFTGVYLRTDHCRSRRLQSFRSGLPIYPAQPHDTFAARRRH